MARSKPKPKPTPMTKAGIIQELKCRPQWRASSFGSDAFEQTLLSLDVSPEEMRVRAVLSQRTDTVQQYIGYEADTFAEAQRNYNRLLGDLQDSLLLFEDDGSATLQETLADSAFSGARAPIPKYTTDTLSKDLTDERPGWPLSSYGPAKYQPTLLGGLDESPEELRLKAMQSLWSGTVEKYMQYEAEKQAAAVEVYQSALASVEQTYQNALKNEEACTITSSGFDIPVASDVISRPSAPAPTPVASPQKSSAWSAQAASSGFSDEWTAPAIANAPIGSMLLELQAVLGELSKDATTTTSALPSATQLPQSLPVETMGPWSLSVDPSPPVLHSQNLPSLPEEQPAYDTALTSFEVPLHSPQLVHPAGEQQGVAAAGASSSGAQPQALVVVLETGQENDWLLAAMLEEEERPGTGARTPVASPRKARPHTSSRRANWRR